MPLGDERRSRTGPLDPKSSRARPQSEPGNESETQAVPARTPRNTNDIEPKTIFAPRDSEASWNEPLSDDALTRYDGQDALVAGDSVDLGLQTMVNLSDADRSDVGDFGPANQLSDEAAQALAEDFAEDRGASSGLQANEAYDAELNAELLGSARVVRRLAPKSEPPEGAEPSQSGRIVRPVREIRGRGVVRHIDTSRLNITVGTALPEPEPAPRRFRIPLFVWAALVIVGLLGASAALLIRAKANDTRAPTSATRPSL